MRFLLRRALLLSLALSAAVPAFIAAQQTPASSSVNVFLDCQGDGDGCDFDFFRQEIKSVNWVRDRTVADVHVLLTSQQTGAGGEQYNLAFLGQGRFAGIGDTLQYSTSPTAVDDEIRRGIAQVLRVGLVRYVARSAGYGGLRISFGEARDSAQAPPRDPWNFWVFELGVSGYGEGERTDKSRGADAEIEIRRITDQWKTTFEVNADYEENQFDLNEEDAFTSIRRDYDFEFEHVKSIGARFALGLTGGIGSSTFSNTKRLVKFAPAVEFAVFPYSEATRRALTFQYAVGMTHYIYEDTTLYFKLREGIAVQQFMAELSARQPWGTVGIEALFRNQIKDAAKRRASIGGEIEVRVLRGLSVNFGANVSSIKDQINLRLEDASDEEILVRQRERATSYRYGANFGISYTFGSIFNNVVNPRFNLGPFF
jgi:hypothetical protein